MILGETFGLSHWCPVTGLCYSDAGLFKLSHYCIGLTLRKGKNRTLKHSVKIDIWILLKGCCIEIKSRFETFSFATLKFLSHHVHVWM